MATRNKPSVPPGILKQVEEAAQRRRDARSGQSTPSSTPTPAPTEKVIDTMKNVPATEPQKIEQENAPAQPQETKKQEGSVEIVFSSHLNNTFIFRQIDGQNLLTICPTKELGMIGLGLLAVIAVLLGIKKLLPKKKNPPKLSSSSFPILDGTQKNKITKISL